MIDFTKKADNLLHINRELKKIKSFNNNVIISYIIFTFYGTKNVIKLCIVSISIFIHVYSD